ncbi:hypothetical protein HPP92_004406 [Vanilla planifolia]|uniref:Protein kinase domain-containing protein n=1 Tax=Vanilla planifolia TaxID=51239 RepID=A0A835RXB3_VANPL|nr:hypothetical protein HPP92_004406 [Vanilla planifolia]
MAPEYALNGYLSSKSDVFSFGILLLEIVSGRKNLDETLGVQEVDLLSYVSCKPSPTKIQADSENHLLQFEKLLALCIPLDKISRRIVKDLRQSSFSTFFLNPSVSELIYLVIESLKE